MSFSLRTYNNIILIILVKLLFRCFLVFKIRPLVKVSLDNPTSEEELHLQILQGREGRTILPGLLLNGEIRKFITLQALFHQEM